MNNRHAFLTTVFLISIGTSIAIAGRLGALPAQSPKNAPAGMQGCGPTFRNPRLAGSVNTGKKADESCHGISGAAQSGLTAKTRGCCR